MHETSYVAQKYTVEFIVGKVRVKHQVSIPVPVNLPNVVFGVVAVFLITYDPGIILVCAYLALPEFFTFNPSVPVATSQLHFNRTLS